MASSSQRPPPEEMSSDNFQVVPSTPVSSDVDDDETPLIQQQPDDEDENQQQPTETTAGPVPWSPAAVMIANLIKKLLMPILRVLFAPKTQKTLVKSVAIVILVLWVVLTSVAAYLAFYRQYVPRTAHIKSIYFQYQHNIDEGPLATVDLTQGQPYNPLRHEQTYDVFVRLHVPTSDINFDLGNFMIQIWLQTREGESVVHSSRPAILRYQSKAQRILHVFAKALPLLVGLTEESQVITVPLIEDYVEHKSKPVTQATIAISNPRLQIYDAEIRLMADFRGLRYFMYHRRIVTALGFIVMFIIIELVCAAIAWRFFGQNLWNALHSALEEMAEEQQRQQLQHQQEQNNDDETETHTDKVSTVSENDHESE